MFQGWVLSRILGGGGGVNRVRMQDYMKTWWACLLILLGYLTPDQLAAKAYELTIDETGNRA